MINDNRSKYVMKKVRQQFIWTGLSCVLLVGIGIEGRVKSFGANAAFEYHQNIKLLAAQVPHSVGSWVGTEVPLPGAELLKANSIISRRYVKYTGKKNDLSVTIIFVHCSDSRDLIGHYPPHCYPAQGWTKQYVDQNQMFISGLDIRFTEYGFIQHEMLNEQSMSVLNFLVLPDGNIVPNMKRLMQMSQNSRLKFYGAGQAQIITSSGLPASEKAEIYEFSLRILRPIINKVLSGEKDEY